MPRKLKVYTICTFVPRFFTGQWRYVAAVSSMNEFARLIGCPLHQIRDYLGETSNENEIQQAMANPHTLIPIKPVDYSAKRALKKSEEAWLKEDCPECGKE